MRTGPSPNKHLPRITGALLFANIFIWLGSFAPLFAQPASPYKNIREALQAIKTAKNPDEQQRVYGVFQQTPIEGRADLLALHQELRRRQDNVPTFSDDKSFDDFLSRGQILAVRLSSCTDARFQDDIAALIDQETASFPKDSAIPLMPIGKMDLAAGAKSSLRISRISALLEAAGDGKNEKARAALWRMVDVAQDAYFGQLAVVALGKIGRPEDLERLVQMVEKNPQLKLPLGDFGGATVPILLREIKNPQIPIEIQARLSAGLTEAGAHENLSTYVLLLHDKNKLIARASLLAIANNLKSSDEEEINELLKDSSINIRAAAYIALDGRAWDDRYIPLLRRLIPKDDDAAKILGHHKVKAAIPDLQNALQDSHPYIRSAAQIALDEINTN